MGCEMLRRFSGRLGVPSTPKDVGSSGFGDNEGRMVGNKNETFDSRRECEADEDELEISAEKSSEWSDENDGDRDAGAEAVIRGGTFTLVPSASSFFDIAGPANGEERIGRVVRAALWRRFICGVL